MVDLTLVEPDNCAVGTQTPHDTWVALGLVFSLDGATLEQIQGAWPPLLRTSTYPIDFRALRFSFVGGAGFAAASLSKFLRPPLFYVRTSHDRHPTNPPAPFYPETLPVAGVEREARISLAHRGSGG